MNDQAFNWLPLAQMAAPLAATLLAALLAIPAYLINARVNRAETLLAKRREIFSAYVQAVQLNLIGRKDKMSYHAAYADIFIYGTDAVIRTVSSFHKEVADKAGQIDGERAAELYAHMVKAMRADCFSSSKLKTLELKKMLPFDY